MTMCQIEQYLREALATAERKAATVDGHAAKMAYLDLVDHYRFRLERVPALMRA